MAQFGAMTPPPQVVAKNTDMRTLANAFDGKARSEPIVTYEFPNGRKFTEPQNDPAGYD